MHSTQSRFLRLHLFEFEDLPWFPAVIRRGMMDYLRHMISWSGFYNGAATVIRDLCLSAKTNHLVELCAGAGGGTGKLVAELGRLDFYPHVRLTDLYPDPEGFKEANPQPASGIRYEAHPVDARRVPEDWPGVRTMFSALHHFKPEVVKEILMQAERQKKPVAFFDAAGRNPLHLVWLWLVAPVSFLLLTPFFKPFKWSRIIFTYIIPLIILCTLWDGSVSALRFYTLSELKEIARSLPSNQYLWTVGSFRNRIGIRVHYIRGQPA